MRRISRTIGTLLATAVLLLGSNACKEREEPSASLPLKADSSFETTARVRYKQLETVMTIYKKPLNCALITFISPDSLRDLRMIFYADKVELQYKEWELQFTPGSLPSEAAGRMILSAMNAALAGNGISITQEDGRLCINGEIEEGAFQLLIDQTNGNILKLSIPSKELEVEVLNFKLLE